LTAREVISIFNKLYDQYADEGLDPQDKSRHINTATLFVMRDRFYRRHGKRELYTPPPYGMEETNYDSEDFRTILRVIPLNNTEILKTDDDGRLLISDIEAFFPTNIVYDEIGQVESTRCKFFHLNSAARWDGTSGYQPADWVRHDEKEEFRINPHRRPTDRFPWVTYHGGYIQFEPAGRRDVRVSVTRHPKHFWYQGDFSPLNVDPELPVS
jgi:hypothetical protein